jgi:hypothetical protein
VINIGAFIVSLSTAFFLTNFLESGSGFDAKLAGLFKISDLRHTGVLGLALGFSIGQIFDSALMYFALVKFAKKKFNFAAKFPAVEIIKMSAAALVAGAAAYSVRLALSDVTLLNTFFSVFWEGLAVGFAGIVIYFAALFLLKSEDIYSFAESFKRGLFKLKMLPKNWDGSERDIQLPPAN